MQKITRCRTPSTKQVGSGKYPQGEKAQEKMLRGRYSEEGFCSHISHWEGARITAGLARLCGSAFASLCWKQIDRSSLSSQCSCKHEAVVTLSNTSNRLSAWLLVSERFLQNFYITLWRWPLPQNIINQPGNMVFLILMALAIIPSPLPYFDSLLACLCQSSFSPLLRLHGWDSMAETPCPVAPASFLDSHPKTFRLLYKSWETVGLLAHST